VEDENDDSEDDDDNDDDDGCLCDAGSFPGVVIVYFRLFYAVTYAM